jgi:hypothetical protein
MLAKGRERLSRRRKAAKEEEMAMTLEALRELEQVTPHADGAVHPCESVLSQG